MKKRLYNIIFKADTREGILFDVVLLILILASVLLVMLESIVALDEKYSYYFNIFEWIITILFTIEYFLRIYISEKPKKYIFSSLGIIDLLSIVPKYISLFLVGSNLLISLRALRLLRVFRILKLAHYIKESNKLVQSLKASRIKISVFLLAVVVLCILLGTVMYIVEGAENGFTSIPQSVYWCIVTMTTVGFGDVAPGTPLGKLIAALVMIIGYGIIAVPTGIVSAEYAQQQSEEDKFKKNNAHKCTKCGATIISQTASFCHHCGSPITNG
ncbi:ion transporter [Aquimarina agarivorans]|uniref:ion transporter n=1 Tax=Aquimarina agarivorans TaxID=980584 RepID=UPI000248EAF5|nr:ion transporter [Aquimarina agarivorans]